MRSHVFTIARLELTAVARLKWIRLLAAAFALLAAAAAYSAGAADGLSGADGFARTTLTLVPAVLILVPLAALVLGVSGQAADAGGQPFLFGQPVSRGSVFVGRWLGEALALGGAVAGGLVAGAVIVLSGSASTASADSSYSRSARLGSRWSSSRWPQPSRRPPTNE